MMQRTQDRAGHRRRRRHRPRRLRAARARRLERAGGRSRCRQARAGPRRGHVASLAADVTSEDDNRRMVAEAEARFGGLDAAILNAGITGGGSIDELPFEDFQKVIAVNLFGAGAGHQARCCRCCGGRAAARSSSPPRPWALPAMSENWAYCASKHALIGLVRSLSRELGWEGIRINALCPGPTRTPA